MFRIGDTNISNDSFVWTDNKSYSDMRQNERLIFSRIDFLLSYLTTDEATDPEAILNVISVYYVDLQLIREFGGNPDLLYKAGTVLSNYVNELLTMAPSDRQTKVLSIIDTVKQKTINGNMPIGDLRFMAEWEKDICANNYYIDFRTGIATQTAPTATVSGTEGENFMNEFKKVSANLVYTRVPYSMMETPEAKRKYSQQVDVISELCASGFGFTGAICSNLIESQVMQTWGNTPTSYVQAMKDYVRENRTTIGVGEPISAAAVLILKLVTAAIAAGATVFVTIFNYRHRDQTTAAKSALYNARASYADFTDWLSIGDIDGDGKDDTLKVYGLGALALLGLWYYNKKK